MIREATCERRPGPDSALGKFSQVGVTRHEGSQNADFYGSPITYIITVTQLRQGYYPIEEYLIGHSLVGL